MKELIQNITTVFQTFVAWWKLAIQHLDITITVILGVVAILGILLKQLRKSK